jgi:N-acetylmuramoyl-L-alanine amidase
MAQSRVWLPALIGATLGALALVLWPAPVWPEAGARVVVRSIELPSGFGMRRVAIDPGHGARDNSGNRSAFCVDEQDFTLALAELVAERLEQSGGFDVTLTRRRGELVDYADRVARAEAWGAEALVSIHSDVRGRSSEWEPRPDLFCRRSRSEPGYAVIYSDDAEPALVERRRTLALELGRSLEQSRFLAYTGPSYALDYQASDEPGVFVDRRAPRARIFVLRRPRIPSVLIETHNALHDGEAARWDEPETREAFAAAVARALIGALFRAKAEPQSAAL